MRAQKYAKKTGYTNIFVECLIFNDFSRHSVPINKKYLHNQIFNRTFAADLESVINIISK
jgi:hypothetical protein